MASRYTNKTGSMAITSAAAIPQLNILRRASLRRNACNLSPSSAHSEIDGRLIRLNMAQVAVINEVVASTGM